MLRKFMVIGLGGSGGKTVRYLKQAIEEWMRLIGWTGGMPEGWQFLHIDTPAQQDSPVIPGSPRLLSPEEYLSLYQDGIGFSAIVHNLEGQGERFAGWRVDPDYMTIPIATGAGQYRAVGQVLGRYHAVRIRNAVTRKEASMMSAGATAQLREISELSTGASAAGAQVPPPVAIVVSSLAGGTGAGLVMDVCDILRSGGDKWLDESIAILYAADVFNHLSSSASAGVQPNSAAAIAELLHGHYNDGAFVPPGGGPVQQRSGPAFPYLVGHANTKGVTFGDQIDVYRVMGRCLSAVVTDLTIQDDYTSYTAANWKASAGKFHAAGGAKTMLMEPPSYQGAFQGLGFAEVELGVERLETYAERRITRDAIEWFLGGHRLMAAEVEAYEDATEEEIVAGLAEEAFTRFLLRSGINERSRDNNQVLDALRIEPARLKAQLQVEGQHIFEAAQEQLGKRAKPRDWVDAIVEEIEVRQNGVVKGLDDQLRDTAGRWVDEATGRMVDVVGDFVAERGAVVTLRLLDMAAKEVDVIVKELDSEHWEFESLASHLRSDVENAIDIGSGGALPSDNDRIVRAIGVGIATGIIHRYESKLSMLASKLLADFRAAVLAPLTRAVREAHDALLTAVGPDGGDSASTPIDDWPRHHPRSDQRVPDSLRPGQSIKSLLDITAFPELFIDLTHRTLGQQVTPDEAVREVRRHALLGADGAADRWAKITDMWRPSESLMLGSAAAGPAAFATVIGRDEIATRARTWLRGEGSAWDGFLSLGIRGYLSDSVVHAERVQRERRFKAQLEAAFEASEPLVDIDRQVLDQIHQVSVEIRPVASEIPVAGLPIEDTVRDLLTARTGGDAQTAAKPIGGSERITRISIYSSLGGAYHPAVFRSLTDPITMGWERAGATHALHDFWQWRRARPLSAAVPVPRPTLRAMLRGWFIGRLLGCVTIEHGVVVLHTHAGELRSPDLLPLGGQRPWDVLAALVETLTLAIPAAATNKDPAKYLAAYETLIDWGREPGTKSSELSSFRSPSKVLEAWLDGGVVPHGGTPVVVGGDRSGRAEAAAALIADQVDEYRQKASSDADHDRGSNHAWLGLADLIIEELRQVESCLADASGPGPSL